MQKAFEKLIENELFFAELACKQFADKENITREKIKNILTKRGKKIREVISTTNALIEEHITPFLKNPTILTHEYALELEELAEKLSSYRESVDVGLCCDIREALTIYAKHINDDEMYIRNMFFNGLALFYLDSYIFKPHMSDCFDKIMAFSDRYEEFPSEIRNLIVRAYGNSYISVANLEINEIFRRYDRALDFWNNTAKKVDPDFTWEAFYLNTCENICSTTISILRSSKSFTVTDNHKKRLLESAETLYAKLLQDKNVKTNDYTSGQVKFIYYYYAAKYYNDLITSKELLTILINIHNQADNDYNYDDLYKKLHIAGLYLYYLHFDPPPGCTKVDQERIAKEIEADVFNYVESIPQKMSSLHVSTLLTNFAIGSHFIFDDYTYLKLVLSLTVFRHVPTYVHSVMVAKIAFVITEYLIKYMPQQLVGLPGINNIEDVKSKSAEILLFVWFSGLIHDIGKISYSHLVSFYVRKLNDKEFELIKQHSLKAEPFIKKAPNYIVQNFVQEEVENASSINFNDNPKLFACFSDIAYGHHKTFDGNFGYPPEFDNLKSPVKPIIDIISIADSIDAATDSVGRSYANEKSLEDMQDDLMSQISTRYCPIVTSTIFSNEKLFNAIKNVLSDFRYDLYYSCFYSDDFSKTMVPPGATLGL